MANPCLATFTNDKLEKKGDKLIFYYKERNAKNALS